MSIFNDNQALYLSNKYKIDINNKDIFLTSCKKGYIEIIQYLLYKTNNFFTDLDMIEACKNGHVSIITLLVKTYCSSMYNNMFATVGQYILNNISKKETKNIINVINDYSIKKNTATTNDEHANLILDTIELLCNSNEEVFNIFNNYLTTYKLLLYNLLEISCHYKHLDILKHLLSKCLYKTTDIDNIYNKLLTIVSRKGYLDFVIYLLDNYEHINIDKENLLYNSICSYKKDVILYILNKYSDININNNIIHSLIKYGDIEILRIFIQKYPSINYNMILKNICVYDNLLLFMFILKIYPNININDDILLTIYRNNSIHIFKYLLNNNKDINKEKAIYYSCLYDNLSIVKYLLENYNNLNIKNYYNLILEKICKYDKLDLFIILHNYNNINNNNLVKICKYGNLEILKYLLNNNDINKEKVLYYCCLYNHLNMVKYLIKNYTINIHIYNDFILLKICKLGYINIVKYLLKQYDTNYINKEYILKNIIDINNFNIINIVLVKFNYILY